jgi:lipid-binding SYLF domain-containing protein
MNKNQTFLAMAVALAAAGCTRAANLPSQPHAEDRDRAAEELSDATRVLQEMNQIPPQHRQRARCVAVIPALVRAGFVVGARHGEGVVSCRTAAGAWSAPAFIRITGGSAGLQVGVESSDVVMLVMTDRARSQLFRESFTLGADVSASAGPVGQATAAATDTRMRVEILSYARSRGLFAGAELGGAVVEQDKGAMLGMYGPGTELRGVLDGELPAPPEASAFLGALGGI